ncbi:glutamate synthase, putative, partial [Perkinsus marinus ATCC 50983]
MGVGRDSTVVEMSLNKMVKNYRAAAHAGILKVMSKMGISCLSSYKGAQLFQCIGLAPDVRNLCFDACLSSLGGVGFRALQEDALRLHTNAYPSRPLPPLVDAETSRYALPEMGMYHFRSVGNASELHMNAPDVIAKIQESARKDSPTAYKEYEDWENALVDECELRGLLEICYDKCSPIAVESVETETEIVKRFCTGAVSFGAISSPTHEALAMAMNSLGGRSNTGEGGEDEARFGEDNEARSRIKQVASGRFGVTAAYLADADEIQIKLAQGAKPGEGGELPGYKVVGAIAEIRKSTPGVGLISPPPHHDMYSIEDVAQLISDLKHVSERSDGKRGSADIEDVVTGMRRLQDLDMRPASVAFPDKRAGFKLYSRRNPTISRAPKSRVLDWEEIYSKKPHRSRLYDQLLTTQTARCMDCGTPTCHYPNTGGGGCPLGNRIPTFNQLVYEGQWKLALDRLLDTNNFPEFTGTACPAPCEEACVLSINEPPVTIKSVELAIIEHAFQKGWIQPMPPLTRTYKTVAIVGSGPAGLVAAAQLNKAGHSVTVFERADRIGGLLVYGIPNMKLDKIDKVQRRVEILQQEGIEFKTDIEIGVEPFTLSSLRAGYDAVLLATGATQSRDTLTRIPGRQLKGIYQV